MTGNQEAYTLICSIIRLLEPDGDSDNELSTAKRVKALEDAYQLERLILEVREVRA